jgi:hypothetical protein
MIGESAVFFSFFFHTLFLSLFPFCHFIVFVSNSNKPVDVFSCEKRLLLVADRCFGVQVWGMPWPLHTSVPHSTVLYFLPY